MGIDMTCSGASFHSSYEFWNEFRTKCVLAAYEHLKNLKLDENNTHEPDDTGNGEHDYSEYKYGNYKTATIRRHELLEFFRNNVIMGNPRDILPCFVHAIHRSHHTYADACILFGIGGLIALCDKSDCEGHYTVGNAHDIDELFGNIEPYLIGNTTDIMHESNAHYNCMNRALHVFRVSQETRQKVIIS